jgi:hypothetical protein
MTTVFIKFVTLEKRLSPIWRREGESEFVGS